MQTSRLNLTQLQAQPPESLPLIAGNGDIHIILKSGANNKSGENNKSGGKNA